ncbi:amphi-Trp domain-containing protein [Streptomyces sp. Isolate_45]|uniref:amphi-Trp domain-containing protein n=1 Tax=Streptomyces sp. Isolate_45 TaxID=2950111 RepID=UPI002481CC8D|nr:amphi-Trp domain-containing protein [Streptomyces sp. Isolate_45]MDA5279248.1 amphi-Trp domain-containing protein [Streptomyces sp. Isolate_45]
MSDLKFEQKRSLSRSEAAEQLSALAEALREGGNAEVTLGSGVLSLRVPDELRSEIEIEVDGDEIELEIELKWTTGRLHTSARAGRETSPEASDESERAQPRPARPRKTAATAKPRRSVGKRP